MKRQEDREILLVKEGRGKFGGKKVSDLVECGAGWFG